MKREEKLEIKKAIEEKISQLKEDIEILKEHMKPVTLSCVVDRANKMDAINNNAVKDSVYRSSLNKINLLKFLTEKVHDPDYGICRKCGTDINFQRLKLLPESTLCIRCADSNF
jgi:DnaK suppressor protein